MILTDYYCFEKLPDQKSKLRIDCTASTKGYPDFESLRNKAGELFVYIGGNTHTKAGEKRKADLAISKTKHISSVYLPDVTGTLAYGDMVGTKDAMLFIFSNADFVEGKINTGAKIEILIARGQRNNRSQLFNLLSDGELEDEITALKKQAVTETVTEKKD
ncbi:hypothetical protein EZS27_024064 [termite gut metagenome]|uniref:Uncharacterized protein n=1 Tax=termite gut metagenome TaxID=433724 RepID=A0A5J4QY68_9ZZZZ